MVDAPHDHSLLDRTIVTVPSPEALSGGYEDTWKNSTIEPRSRRDRAAIVELKLWNRLHSIKTTTNGDLGSRLTHDRDSIVVRLWQKLGSF